MISNLAFGPQYGPYFGLFAQTTLQLEALT